MILKSIEFLAVEVLCYLYVETLVKYSEDVNVIVCLVRCLIFVAEDLKITSFFVV